MSSTARSPAPAVSDRIDSLRTRSAAGVFGNSRADWSSSKRQNRVAVSPDRIAGREGGGTRLYAVAGPSVPFGVGGPSRTATAASKPASPNEAITCKSPQRAGAAVTGFLKGAEGTFKGFFNGMAGQGWADWLFMIGLAGIGLALILGIGMRIAAASGALLLVLMWAAEFPLANNPFMDDHIVYALVLVALALAGAGRTLGLGAKWEQLSFVQKNGWLK